MLKKPSSCGRDVGEEGGCCVEEASGFGQRASLGRGDVGEGGWGVPC